MPHRIAALQALIHDLTVSWVCPARNCQIIIFRSSGQFLRSRSPFFSFASEKEDALWVVKIPPTPPPPHPRRELVFVHGLGV